MLVFQLYFTERNNYKEKGIQLRSMLTVCGRNLIFCDGDFLQSLRGLFDLSNSLTMELCLAPTADSPSIPVGMERGQLSWKPLFPGSLLLKRKMKKKTEITSHFSFLTGT